jgi:putative effector of murein hydrolase
MIILLSAVFICIIIYEVPGLIKNKYWRELAVFSFLLSIAFLISILYTLKIKPPNPVRDTQYFVKSLIPFSYE